MRYFTSDPHWSHKSIINWGRPQFDSIEDHDGYLVKIYKEWAEKLKPEDEFFVLGDWGNLDYLWVMDYFMCKTIFVYGNHDKKVDLPIFEQYFDEVHEYPYYLSNKLCISHIPQNVYPDQINVYGHTHSMVVDDVNHICVCLEANDYHMVADKKIASRFAQLPQYNRRFLQEPYAESLKVLDRPENDLILLPNKHINIPAQLAFNKMKEEMKK